MALIQWRNRDVEGKPFGPTYYIQFDATVLEEYSRSANLTTFPVESGAVLSDHYQPQPRALTIEGSVSNHPVQTFELLEGKQNAAALPVGFVRPQALDLPVDTAPVAGLVGQRLVQGNVSRVPKKRTASVLVFDGKVTRTVDVFNVLDALMERSKIVDVVVYGNQQFNDMMIVNVRAPRDSLSGSSINFTIDLLQVKFANTDNTASNQNAGLDKYKGKKRGGNRNPKPLNTGSRAAARAQGEPWYLRQRVIDSAGAASNA